MLQNPPEVMENSADLSAADAIALDDNTDVPEPVRAPLAALGVDLDRISIEIQSINSGFQAQMAEAIARSYEEMELGFRTRLEGEQAAIRAEFLTTSAHLNIEIERIGGELKAVSTEITHLLDDPNAELSAIMRKKAEEGVLHAYLNGLQFAANLFQTSIALT